MAEKDLEDTVIETEDLSQYGPDSFYVAQAHRDYLDRLNQEIKKNIAGGIVDTMFTQLTGKIAMRYSHSEHESWAIFYGLFCVYTSFFAVNSFLRVHDLRVDRTNNRNVGDFYRNKIQRRDLTT
jgi:hypothetical protein